MAGKNQTSERPLAEAASARAVEQFINKEEVARRLGKTIRTIDNWMSQGLLPYFKIGHSVAFKWSEVEAHLQKSCRVLNQNPAASMR